MKNKLPFLLPFLFLILVACDNSFDEKEGKNLSDSTNKALQAYVQNLIEYRNFATGNPNRDKIMKYYGTSITEENIDDVVRVLGFQDLKEFVNYTNVQNKNLSIIRQNNIRPYAEVDKFVSTYAMNLYKTLMVVDPITYAQGDENARLACLASVAAQAAMMNLACGAADLTVAAGLACHAAVLVYQVSESYLCNMHYGTKQIQ